jgi:hypothetical protein
LILDDLAREQAIIDSANEDDLTLEDAAEINRFSFRNRGERTFLKNQYRVDVWIEDQICQI